MSDKVIRLPTARRSRVKNPQPEPVEEVAVDVPELLDGRAARRPWFQDRWRSFHFANRSDEYCGGRLHFQFRRRRL